MSIHTRRSLIKLGAVAGAMAALPSAAFALAAKTVKRFTSGKSGGDHAIEGYDATAYFTSGKASLGDVMHRVSWKGAEWIFESAEAAGRFEAAPENYAPQFGGYCTRAMSRGRIVPADAQVWRIHNDRLYVFARPVGGEKFDEGRDAMIEKAQSFWDTLTLVE